jgi:outer membrane protein
MKSVWCITLSILASAHLSVAIAQSEPYGFYDLLTHCNATNYNLKIEDLNIRLAQNAERLAQYEFLEPVFQVNYNYQNNTELPVSLFPAETFGGKEGEFVRVQTGNKYAENFNQSAEISLIQPGSVSKWKAAQAQTRLAQLNKELTKQDLFKEIANAYATFQSAQRQLEFTLKAITALDSIVQLSKLKWQAGTIDKAQLIQTELKFVRAMRSLEDIELTCFEQHSYLMYLAGLDGSTQLEKEDSLFFKLVDAERMFAYGLKLEQLETATAYESYMRKYENRQALPSLSLVGSNTFQNFGNSVPMSTGLENWIQSNYIGFSITWRFGVFDHLTKRNKGKVNGQIDQMEEELEKNRLKYEQVKQQGQKTYLLSLWQNQELYATKVKYLFENANWKYKVGSIDPSEVLEQFEHWCNEHVALESYRLKYEMELINNWIFGYE